MFLGAAFEASVLSLPIGKRFEALQKSAAFHSSRGKSLL
ncbi:UNVERIFIED_ORG: hypothetical protein QOE_3095 [Clostridioides difficile F501]|nr:hypothetical protein HMPREF9404_4789 [Eggerthella sp. HGA1]